MDIGMDSILAEYHRELQKQYNLFAIDCSYGTESASTKLTESHLLEYMNRNFSLEDVFLEKLLYRDFFAVQAEEAQAVKADVYKRQTSCSVVSFPLPSACPLTKSPS